MSTENGQIEQVEIIPDFDNEMVEEIQEQPVPTPPSPCGCNKGKNTPSKQEIQTSINWMRIIMIAGGVVVAYFIFKNMGKGKKIETPKVEIPEVS